MTVKKPYVLIHTDGACSNARGGWSAMLQCGDEVLHLAGNEQGTTNNRMELLAVIKALEKLTTSCEVDLFSDSKYVVDGLTSWVKNWKRNNWKTKDGKKVLNVDLWKRALILKEKHKVRLHWVKGHNGTPENEAVDSLAQLLRTLPM